MESIKAAAKAIRKSPNMIRKKITPSADGHASTLNSMNQVPGSMTSVYPCRTR